MILLVALVVVPSFLLLTLGVVLLFIGEAGVNLLMGILVMALSGIAATGVVLVWVFVRREANLSRLQSDFVSKVSHELRTPLTSIRLFAETLELRRGDASGRDEVHRGACDARPPACKSSSIGCSTGGAWRGGNKEFVLRDTDLRSIVATALDAFEPVRRAAQRRARGDASAGVAPGARGSRRGRGRALQSPDERLQVRRRPAEDRARVRRGAEGGARHGARQRRGIEASEHSRIFQRFYRVDDRLSREREGSGLGLAIVKHVMKAHQGRVELDSSLGKGSVFSLVLPVVKPSTQRKESAERRGGAPRAAES